MTEKNFGKVDHSHSSPAEGEFNAWKEEADAAVWALQDEGGDAFQYINLDLNPEKFTGCVSPGPLVQCTASRIPCPPPPPPLLT